MHMLGIDVQTVEDLMRRQIQFIEKQVDRFLDLLRRGLSICGVMAPAIFGVMAPPQSTEIRGSNGPQEWLFFPPVATGAGAGGDRGWGRR